MTRPLLFAEAAILREAGASSDSDAIATQQVWREYHAPPRTKRQQWFNTDFVIECDNWDHSDRPKVRSIPVLPRTMGGTFFAMITPSGVPTQLELLEGESIGKSSFSEEIARIETAVESISAGPRPIAVNKAPYLRVARLNKCVVFWVCSTTEILPLLNTPAVRFSTGRDEIECRATINEILIDGVIYD